MMSEKPYLNIAVLGHEDSGKSSVVGQLLLSAGKVDDDTWDWITENCQNSNKGYAELAWICDTLEDERERDCSTNITTRTFETSKYNVILTDLPGHHKYVKSAIVGLCGAECALVVVPAAEDEFIDNYKSNGQLREHCLLAHSLGVRKLIAAVNKMDTCGWSEDQFGEIDQELRRYFRNTGFHDRAVTIIPVSAIDKENITTTTETASWYNGPTLIEAMDEITLSNPVHRFGSSTSLRVAIRDVRQVPSVGTVAIGIVLSGTLNLGMSVTVFPTGDTFDIYTLESFGEAIDEGKPGMMVAFTPSDDSVELRRGYIISAAEEPAVGCNSFIATFFSHHPGKIHNGYTPVVHCGTARVPCRFELLHLINQRTGQVEEDNPDFVGSRDLAIVKMVPTKPMYVDESRVFSRLIIRDNGRTIGLGGVRSVERVE